ncbi:MULTISPECIES: TrkA C-terminal domain-containing protein [Clostridium]|uniref:GntR family transcriptional regulator n=1 Tax=Clostridium sulfidigenes TaxID=318464 RepID=A0A084JHF6_9CLOT|nr:TrkA C-terminal domain-containing protein [Clostridium sulfidigenes]KEZ88390.1 GntR family transcriptional regulator [Clostridium sulfidigenes]HBA03566.1 GntR family transcriptional regulator [Clostridium sp.]
MENKFKITSPRYQQIAADVAAKIVDGHYKVGDKIYARSSLASQYGVSSETARRAICVLSDLNIVDTSKGSGVTIKSYENAIKFVKQHDDINTISNLKQDIIDSVDRQKKEIKFLYGCLSDLIDKTDRLRSVNPFTPFQVEITSATPYINKSASDINFWHNTSATIIAIRRNDSLLMSPGPYAVFQENDIFYFVGDENCIERVKKYLYP